VIVDCKAIYYGNQDSVHVIAIVASDAGVSLHGQLDTGSVNLVYNDKVIETVVFGSEHYVVDPSNPTALGDFRVFFYHLQVQRELMARVTATLTNGQTATAMRPVGQEKDPDDPTNFTNPMLAGRNPISWAKQEQVDYRRES